MAAAAAPLLPFAAMRVPAAVRHCTQRGSRAASSAPGCLRSQRRWAVGKGGPGYDWKRTILAERYRRQGPVKRRVMQLQYGRKMGRERDDGGFGPPQPELDAEGGGRRRSQFNWPPQPGEREVLAMFGTRFASELPWPFLIDPLAAEKVVSQCGAVRERIVIVAGAGAGLLVRAFAEAGAPHVLAVENDERWDAHLGQIRSRSKGRVVHVKADALTADYPEMLREQLGDSAPGPRPWDEVAEVLLFCALPMSLGTPFRLRMLAHCAQREGIFSLGRVRLGLIQPHRVALSMAALPQYDEFSAQSLQYQAVFDPRMMYVMNPRSFLGPLPSLARAAPNPPCVVTLDPLPEPRCHLSPEVLHDTSLALLSKRRQQVEGADEGGASRTRSLFYLISRAVGQGAARKVLDETMLDGALSPASLTTDDLYRVCEAMAHSGVQLPTARRTAGGAEVGTIEEYVAARPTAARHAPEDWDPLLSGWAERAAEAPRW
eukprot:TRINITY_DN28213_c0_g1_i1.p1 TRINITY_DN28213_c0_g1~~TRINITY_DN28213_c0_g1_i1.p1  ORF type:complete len:488 (+),score=124.78 TRINITY_DN28213_c0_g1_i1:91-1554(+)